MTGRDFDPSPKEEHNICTSLVCALVSVIARKSKAYPYVSRVEREVARGGGKEQPPSDDLCCMFFPPRHST